MTTLRRKGVLAIDHGTKRCGFAAIDGLRIAATPLDAHHGTGDALALWKHIDRLLGERDIDTMLLGFPFNMDGTSGARANEVEAFALEFARRHPQLRIVKYDERLTTKAAEELLRDAGHRGREAKLRRDSWSALVLLRDWIAAGEPD